MEVIVISESYLVVCKYEGQTALWATVIIGRVVTEMLFRQLKEKHSTVFLAEFVFNKQPLREQMWPT
jgi:hypothetical protein